MEASASVSVGSSTGRFGLDDMLPLPLTRSWCAMTRLGGVDVVGHFDSYDGLSHFTTVV